MSQPTFLNTQMHQQTHLNTKATHKNTHKPSPTHRLTPLTNILMSDCAELLPNHHVLPRDLCARLPTLLSTRLNSLLKLTPQQTLWLLTPRQTQSLHVVQRRARALCKPAACKDRTSSLPNFKVYCRQTARFSRQTVAYEIKEKKNEIAMWERCLI